MADLEWNTSNETMKRKFQFDNARIMCSQMVDEGCDIRFTQMKDYQWIASFNNENASVTMFSGMDGDYKMLSNAYQAWVNGRG